MHTYDASNVDNDYRDDDKRDDDDISQAYRTLSASFSILTSWTVVSTNKADITSSSSPEKSSLSDFIKLACREKILSLTQC